MSGDESERHGDTATMTLLAEGLEPSAPDPDVRARLLEALRGPERWAPFAAEVARAFGVELAAAREALGRVHDPAAWVPGFWPGSRVLITQQLMKAQTVISELPPGIRIPRHRHGGRELTYILDGVLVENESLRHGAGKLLDMTAGSEHEVSVPDDSECLVVFSSRPA
jgi:putative transcriptional regulator